jgi:ribosomal protein L11 methyltransferase
LRDAFGENRPIVPPNLMILWQKQASARWLTANETRLEEFAPSRLAIITRPGRTRGIAQVVCRRRRQAENLRRRFGGKIQMQPRNWLQSPPHPPIRIGRALEIVRKAQNSSSARPQLIIPAAGAFGTGEHATTAMSLRLLEQATRNFPSGWRLLDAGTGTGILALAARRLGAAEVLGLDHDPRAIASARENARLNRLRRAKFVTGDILQFKTVVRFEVVTANLFSEVLIAALPVFRRAARSGGALIASGILREQAAEVIRALARAGFHLEKQRRCGKWIALLATRKS